MGTHIGSEIERRLIEMGMTKAEFGRRIITSRQNVSLILQKESMDTAALHKICRVLDHNFFQYISYTPKCGNGADLPPPPKVRLTLELSAAHQEKVLEMVFGKNKLDFLEQF